MLTVSKGKKKRLSNPVIINEVETTTFDTVKVVEYVDLSTGEILTSQEAKNRGVVELDYGFFVLQREALLNSLRKEVKDFALFVLKFRNKRRGVTPNAQELCKMYAELYGKKTSNVRRLLDKIKEKGILVSDDLLAPMFQFSGKNMSAKDHLSEQFIAEVTYEKLRRSIQK